jgi:general secretion pathway protein G
MSAVASRRSGSLGFTLIELIITLTILALLGTMVVPVANIIVQRTKEQELRRGLNQIRDAIDAYKAAAEQGRIKRDAQSTGYPPSLDVLVEGVEDQRSPDHRKIYFLRRVPRDPFSPDSEASDADTWQKRSYASDASSPEEGDDVYDVMSRSPLVGLNGRPYREW